MHVTNTVTSTKGSSVVQPPDQSTWGAMIAPGSYRQLEFIEEHDECVAEDSGGGITLSAESGGSYLSSTLPS
jgi:hypothetical protein